jgi:hypothetical protein
MKYKDYAMENNYKGHRAILLGILILLLVVVIMSAIKDFTHLFQTNEIHPKTLESKLDSLKSPLIDSMYFPKITLTKNTGISALFKSNYGDTKIHKNSSLTREWIVLNEAGCPIQLTNSVGINTTYLDRSFRFTATGSLETSEPITAYEVHHVIYNVFGEHLETLSNVEIADINGSAELNKGDSWYGTDNQLVEYMICVSYVATVRTKSGTLWRYNYIPIKLELNKIQIAYEENYRPSLETEKK